MHNIHILLYLINCDLCVQRSELYQIYVLKTKKAHFLTMPVVNITDSPKPVKVRRKMWCFGN